MCTNSSDIINSGNMLFLLEAIYIVFQQCLNQNLFVQKGCNVKKQSSVTSQQKGWKRAATSACNRSGTKSPVTYSPHACNSTLL